MPFDEVMHKFKHDQLRSGSGKKVTDRKQALAIGLKYGKKGHSKPRKKGFTSIG